MQPSDLAGHEHHVTCDGLTALAASLDCHRLRIESDRDHSVHQPMLARRLPARQAVWLPRP